MRQGGNETNLSSILGITTPSRCFPFNYTQHSPSGASRHGQAHYFMGIRHFWCCGNRRSMSCNTTWSRYYALYKGHIVTLSCLGSCAQKDCRNSIGPRCQSVSSWWPRLHTHHLSSARAYGLHLSCSIQKSHNRHHIKNVRLSKEIP